MMCNHRNHSKFIFYTLEQLINISKPEIIFQLLPQVPADLERRCWKYRAGERRRGMNRKLKPFFPLIIIGNMKSLGNYLKEYQALARTKQEYQQCSNMHFNEACLQNHISDFSIRLPGFLTILTNTDLKKTGNSREVVHVTVKICHDSPDIELFAVGFWPYYLPTVFTSVLLVTINVSTSALFDTAFGVVSSVAAKLHVQTQMPIPFVETINHHKRLEGTAS